MGAADGQLGRDILDYFKRLEFPSKPEFKYMAVDRAKHSSADYHIKDGIPHILAADIPLSDITGCFISNELLDAFPVHRFEKKDRTSHEIYVTLDVDNNFTEILDAPSTPELEALISEIAARLPERARWEINPGISAWTAQVSATLKKGFVLTIDYGDLARNLYTPDRSSGTLATYYQHVQVGSPYQRIGRQDITAHIDFSSLMSQGSKNGLQALGLMTQTEFLQQFGLDQFIQRLRQLRLSAREAQENIAGMRELIKPGGLGDFKVLIQEKKTDIARLELFFELHTTLRDLPSHQLPVPLLSPDHMSLVAARYPHATWQPDAYDMP